MWPLRMVQAVLRALRNMRQTPVLSVAAIGTVAVSLSVLALFALVVVNVQAVTAHWSSQVQVVAYLDRPPTDSELQAWRSELAAQPEVAAVNYVSPRQALERFRQRLGEEADLLEGMPPDFLPASLELQLRPEARNAAAVGSLVERLRSEQRFAELRYGRDWLERFSAFVAMLKLIGLLLGGFLIFATLFIVANTIKLTLYARQDELEIMALVGATPLYIKGPFLLEGALQGTIGGALALAGSLALYALVLQEGLAALLLTGQAGSMQFLPATLQWGLVALGTLLGFLGSLVSLRKLVR